MYSLRCRTRSRPRFFSRSWFRLTPDTETIVASKSNLNGRDNCLRIVYTIARIIWPLVAGSDARAGVGYFFNGADFSRYRERMSAGRRIAAGTEFYPSFHSE
jgi:hypothetical protein